MSPSTWNFGTNWPPPRFKKRIFPIDIRSYGLIPYTYRKKFNITNRKSTTGFPMNLRWTANVAPKASKGAQKTQSGRFFRIRVDFFRRKSATKFLCVKTFSGKVVRHSPVYLCTNGWWGCIASYLKFWAKLTNPLEKRRLRIDIRLNHYTERKKVQLSLIGRPLRAFYLRWTAYVAY